MAFGVPKYAVQSDGLHKFGRSASSSVWISSIRIPSDPQRSSAIRHFNAFSHREGTRTKFKSVVSDSHEPRIAPQSVPKQFRIETFDLPTLRMEEGRDQADHVEQVA